MGWLQDKKKRMIGDAPLDELGHALHGIAREYQEAHNRPPTLAEFGETLRTVLAGSNGKIIKDLDGKTVTQVDFKVAAAPKKYDWDDGDAFAVPLPDGTFAFGRVLSRRKPKKGETLVEILAARSRSQSPPKDFLSRKRLFEPYSISGIENLEKGRWPVLQNHPGYRAPDHDKIRLIDDSGDTADVMNADYETVARDVPKAKVPKNATDKDAYAFKKPEVFEKMVMEELNKAGIKP